MYQLLCPRGPTLSRAGFCSAISGRGRGGNGRPRGNCQQHKWHCHGLLFVGIGLSNNGGALQRKRPWQYRFPLLVDGILIKKSAVCAMPWSLCIFVSDSQQLTANIPEHQLVLHSTATPAALGPRVLAPRWLCLTSVACASFRPSPSFDILEQSKKDTLAQPDGRTKGVHTAHMARKRNGAEPERAGRAAAERVRRTLEGSVHDALSGYKRPYAASR